VRHKIDTKDHAPVKHRMRRTPLGFQDLEQQHLDKMLQAGPEVEFLGKLVSANGISVSPSKIEAVKKWPTPKSKKELMSYLGFVNYHRDHLHNYAEMTACLYDLAHQTGEVEWQQCHEKAFQQSKTALISAPCLTYPNANDKFILDTDASDTTIGAVLSQLQNGEERVICFASHVLLKPQRRYCTTRKELLAVVKFCRHFRHYLLGRRFILRTDHNSLVWLMRFKHIEGQLARWLEELSSFDMEIIHRPGKKHCNADGLSRIPDDVPECDCYRAGLDPTTLPCHGCKYCLRAHEQWSRFGNDVDDVIPLATKSVIASVRTVSVVAENDKDMSTDQEPTALAGDCHSDPSPNLDDTLPYADGNPCSNWAPEYPPEQLKIFQQEDPDLAPILKWMEEDVEPTQAELRLQSRATRSLWLCRPCFVMFNHVLYYKFIGCPARQGLCLVVPSELKGEVLKNCHDTKTSGHLGQKKNAR
ncbi:Hypothetical predicted protein, partial [Mytilus galloprovincialis]